MSGQCDGSSGLINLSAAYGYLVAASPEQYASPSNCYWRITVKKGQKIHIDLLDFSLTSRYASADEAELRPEVEYCHVYAEIRETDTSRQFTICAGSEREHRVYSSTTHSVEVFVNPVSGPDDHPKFMFRYQGNSDQNTERYH